jgi:hypothetical protein
MHDIHAFVVSCQIGIERSQYMRRGDIRPVPGMGVRKYGLRTLRGAVPIRRTSGVPGRIRSETGSSAVRRLVLYHSDFWGLLLSANPRREGDHTQAKETPGSVDRGTTYIVARPAQKRRSKSPNAHPSPHSVALGGREIRRRHHRCPERFHKPFGTSAGGSPKRGWRLL